MPVGLLIVTHSSIGNAVVETAATMLNACPVQFDVLAVSQDYGPDEQRAMANAMADRLDQGDGLLVLTDMYGSTPSNIACSLHARGNVRIIAGLNLPMLVRVLNYPLLSLDELADRALSGGRDGIFLCPPAD